MMRKPDTGLVRPYRPLPSDFRERYLEMGWDGICEHYRTNWRVIRRWIIEAGGDELRAERAKIGRKGLRPSRRTRYVLGRTLTAVEGVGANPDPLATTPARARARTGEKA